MRIFNRLPEIHECIVCVYRFKCVCVDVAWRRVLRYVELSHRFDCQPANEYVLGVRVADTILYESPQRLGYEYYSPLVLCAV